MPEDPKEPMSEIFDARPATNNQRLRLARPRRLNIRSNAVQYRRAVRGEIRLAGSLWDRLRRPRHTRLSVDTKLSPERAASNLFYTYACCRSSVVFRDSAQHDERLSSVSVLQRKGRSRWQTSDVGGAGAHIGPYTESFPDGIRGHLKCVLEIHGDDRWRAGDIDSHAQIIKL